MASSSTSTISSALDSEESNDNRNIPSDCQIHNIILSYRFTQPDTYDFHKSTEANYKSSLQECVGKYKEQRKQLDYSYHSYYTPERQRLHDQLIDLFHATRVHDRKTNIVCEAPLENWIVFTAGPMGAGKSHTINWLYTHNLFPLDAFVRVDPDQIRELLPETEMYNALDATQTGYMTQREVGYISEVLTMIALEKGKNAIVDSSMRDAAWFAKYFDCLHQKFPKLKIAILSIEANSASIFRRASRRAKVTGRLVPEKVILDALERVPKTVEYLRPRVDFFARVRNEDDADPVVTECEQHRRQVDFLKQDGVFWHMKQLPDDKGSTTDDNLKSNSIMSNSNGDSHNSDVIVGLHMDTNNTNNGSYLQHVVTRRHRNVSSDGTEANTLREIVEETEQDVIKTAWQEDFAAVWLMECPVVSFSGNSTNTTCVKSKTTDEEDPELDLNLAWTKNYHIQIRNRRDDDDVDSEFSGDDESAVGQKRKLSAGTKQVGEPNTCSINKNDVCGDNKSNKDAKRKKRHGVFPTETATGRTMVNSQQQCAEQR